MKKRLLLLLLLFSPLLAAHSDLFEETHDTLKQIERDLRTASSDIAIVEQLLKFQNLLATYLAEADPDLFLEELQELDPLIEAIGNRSNLFYHRFRPYKFSQAYSVEDKNGEIVCFTNTYRSNQPLTEKEKSQLFFLEVNSFEEYGIHESQVVDEETLSQLVPGQVYNFVVTSDKRIRFAVDEEDPTIYLTTDNGISIKRIRSPNHTILAGNQPVLSAGTFTMWEHDRRQLFFVSNDSGHFRPDFESLQVYKKALVKLGVDRERIICVAIEVDFEKLLASVKRRHERQTEDVIILRREPMM